MALFGDIGKFFTKGLGAAIVTIAPVSIAGGKLISGDVKGARATIGSTPFVRASMGLKALGGSRRGPDNVSPSPQYQMGEHYQPQQYFQPIQYSSGSYDPGVESGGVAWDSFQTSGSYPTTPRGSSTIWD